MEKIKAHPVTSEINVIPLADVMLVMLIIFMVVTPMLSKGVSVDLVMTRNPIAMQEADREDAVLVGVTRDGKVFLGSTPTTPEELPQKVVDLLATQLDKTVYLKADARAMYRRVVEVVDNVRSAGVDNIGLITERIERRAQTAR
jgi:biopolymer transport protein ExbD/biopolymer transport protein TolR